jgi:pyruvate-ferredoxin/flavodoxin oxidoreductase
LFEDNAEYGLGMFMAMKHRRERLISHVQDYVHKHEVLGDKQSAEEKELVSFMVDWLEIRDDKSDKCTLLYDKMAPLFEALLPKTKGSVVSTSLLEKIWSDRDMFPKISQWIVGGDGWVCYEL